MTNATITTTHKQHGLRHDGVQLHRIVPCPAVEFEYGLTHGGYGTLPALLPRKRRGGCSRTHDLCVFKLHLTTLGNRLGLLENVTDQSIALYVGRRTHI